MCRCIMNGSWALDKALDACTWCLGCHSWKWLHFLLNAPVKIQVGFYGFRPYEESWCCHYRIENWKEVFLGKAGLWVGWWGMGRGPKAQHLCWIQTLAVAPRILVAQIKVAKGCCGFSGVRRNVFPCLGLGIAAPPNLGWIQHRHVRLPVPAQVRIVLPAHGNL